MATAIQNSVERWLVHESLRFRYAKSDTDTFRAVITSPGGPDDGTEVFEPKNQPGVIVIGRKCPLNAGQNARFLAMTGQEQSKVRSRISEYCDSIGAVHRFLEENGLNMVGVYTVIDATERQNQSDFSESLGDTARMAGRLKDHLRRTV